MKSFALSFLGSMVLLTLPAVLPAGATTIDFEAQGAGRGGNLTGIPIRHSLLALPLLLAASCSKPS